MPPVTFLLIHGSWHGPWCYGPLVAELAKRGYATETVALPSVGSDITKLGGVADDGAAVSRAAAGLSGDIVVVGHSYGGVAVTEARFGSNLRRLVYLAAFMPDANRTYVSYLPPGPLPPYVELREDGTFVVPEGQARPSFYHDCTDQVAAWAEARLRPQSQSVLSANLTRAAWRAHPATYIVATDDRALPPDFQRSFAPQAASTREINSAHFPMLSRPAELAELLAECAHA